MRRAIRFRERATQSGLALARFSMSGARSLCAIIRFHRRHFERFDFFGHRHEIGGVTMRFFNQRKLTLQFVLLSLETLNAILLFTQSALSGGALRVDVRDEGLGFA